MKTLGTVLLIGACAVTVSGVVFFYCRIVKGNWLEEQKRKEQRKQIRDRLIYEERWEDLQAVEKFWKDHDNKEN